MTAMQPDTLLRVMLVDDEPLARARMRTLLGDCADPPTQVVAEAAGEASSALAAGCITKLKRERTKGAVMPSAS